MIDRLASYIDITIYDCRDASFKVCPEVEAVREEALLHHAGLVVLPVYELVPARSGLKIIEGGGPDGWKRSSSGLSWACGDIPARGA